MYTRVYDIHESVRYTRECTNDIHEGVRYTRGCTMGAGRGCKCKGMRLHPLEFEDYDVTCCIGKLLVHRARACVAYESVRCTLRIKRQNSVAVESVLRDSHRNSCFC